jgi:transglutaminase-like putative cysteine protease
MNVRKAAPWVAGALALLGVACVSVRLHVQREMQLAGGDTLWRLSYTLSFRAEKPGARLSAAFPSDSAHCRVFRQDVLYSGLRPERLRSPLIHAREITLVALHDGEHNVTARFDIHLSRGGKLTGREPVVTLTPEQRAQWLRSDKLIQADHPVVVETLQRIRRQTLPPAELVQQLFEFCHAEMDRSEKDAPQNAAGALERKKATPLGCARALAALCRANKTPARLVTGFEMKEASSVEPHTWVEVFVNGRWEPFDPENGFAREMPHHFLPVRRDGDEIVRLTRAGDLDAHFSIFRLPPSHGGAGARHRSLLGVLDLTRVPLEMHEVLSLILLLPLGGLITSLFRTIVGIRTYGTFTPTLIALSFVFADWRTGVFVFAVVIVLGLASRSLLERLKLLMVPRLSVVLTVVVLIVVFAVSLLDYLHLTPGAQAVLLPMVILTMTVERFYVTAEEDGGRFALQLLAGTMAVALCCYLALRWAAVGSLLFRFPELHLFTIAALILIGRYTGYRLTELWRFRDFGPSRSEGGHA